MAFFVRTSFFFWLTGFSAFLAAHHALAAPVCADPKASNFVVASAKGDLTDPGWGGVWLLQNVGSNERILLRRCSRSQGNTCYFATDVKPGKYYFQQAIPEGNNDMVYPISTAALWFYVTGMGVDYIGHWDIQRSGQVVSKMEIHYELSDLDKIVELCDIRDRKLYLDRTNSSASQIVD